VLLLLLRLLLLVLSGIGLLPPLLHCLLPVGCAAAVGVLAGPAQPATQQLKHKVLDK
jgi:hypothetical protein